MKVHAIKFQSLALHNGPSGNLASHMKRDAMKAQRYNNLNYLQTCNTWLGSMLNEPVCIHGGPA